MMPIQAFAVTDQVIESPKLKVAAKGISFNESAYRTLSNRSIKGKKIKNFNLRKLIKEKSSGYSVVQGGCTDGKYAYYLMVSPTTQKGRVLKVRIKNNKVIKRSKVLNVHHGNGMAYDSKRKKLVVIAREKRKQEITLIDAKTLRITRQQNVKYNNYDSAGKKSLSKLHQKQGLAAIAYVKKYDCYIALERKYHHLLIFDPDSFEAIGMVKTNITGDYPGTFQAMDADAKYVYLLLSYYNERGKVQPYNLILALDWNSEKLLPVVNQDEITGPNYVEEAWYCKNDESGRPDAAIRIRTKHEAENIYHTTDKKGREHFYLSEYYSHYVYSKKGYWVLKRDDRVYDLGII